jgi:hypothetical protein
MDLKETVYNLTLVFAGGFFATGMLLEAMILYGDFSVSRNVVFGTTVYCGIPAIVCGLIFLLYDRMTQNRNREFIENFQNRVLNDGEEYECRVLAAPWDHCVYVEVWPKNAGGTYGFYAAFGLGEKILHSDPEFAQKVIRAREAWDRWCLDKNSRLPHKDVAE